MADLIANLQAAAGAGGGDKLYIEDVFSNTLYTGNASTQTITNNIDLSGKGGMIWSRIRDAQNWALFDTNRGTGQVLTTDSSIGSFNQANSVTAFNNNGYSIGAFDRINTNNALCFSWVFRKAVKFFDVISYTGNGSARTISHNLGSVPGCIIVKRVDAAFSANWAVYHRSLTSASYRLILNDNFAEFLATDTWNSTAPTSTVFSVGNSNLVNANGVTYVAYLFAHDAGGFGDSGSDNAITCGSYVGNGAAGNAITLGYEPQLLLIKSRSTTGNWVMFDNMRGLGQTVTARLYGNLSDAEDRATAGPAPTATGFVSRSTTTDYNVSGTTYVYIAIRRGPMKKPTAGTDVYYAELKAQADLQDTSSVPWPPDLYYQYSRNGTSRTAYTGMFFDRLRGIGWAGQSASGGGNPELRSWGTNVESTGSAYAALKNDSKNITMSTGWNSATYGNYIHSFWRRYPGVFDIVCYTGTGSNLTVSHNLGVAPELMIIKQRNESAAHWIVYSAALGTSKLLYLTLTNGEVSTTDVWGTAPTASNFTVGTASSINSSGLNYVAYLFASLAGVSKVGSYTGNGSSQTINCGFSNGARFFMVKRTDSFGDWWVYDSYRGIVSASDPAFRFNNNAAEETSADAVDTASSGIIVNQESTCNINVNSASYIFLAFA